MAEEIQGAFGTLREDDAGAHRSFRGRLLALLTIIGPGIIVMVGDHDAGGVSTYAQAGQTYGASLLWTLPLLIPVLIVNQEMVVRLGAVAGVGHARLIRERFGKFWAGFSVADLFLLNFLTIATEFIGVSLSLRYFGVSPYVSVPLAALGLVAITASGSFRRWERFMLLFVVANFLVIPLVILAHPHGGPIVHGYFVPGIAGGATSASVLLVIAIVGTTVAPWQLFFQQSNIVDKRITPRWINYERADTVLGSFVTVLAASLIVITTAFALHGHHGVGAYTDAGAVAHLLAHRLGGAAGTLFAIILLNASIIGAAAVTLATSYAFGDIFSLSHSLNRKVRDALPFYGSFSGLVAVAAGIVLIPHAPLGLITTAVQALAGVLLPSATVFLLLLCNDPEVLGPWRNRPWLNALSSVIVGVLVALSLVLMVTTVLPNINVTVLVEVLAIAFGVFVVGGIGTYVVRAPKGLRPVEGQSPRETWRMPPMALLKPAPPSRIRRAVLVSMGGYLILAVALLLVKAIQLGLGGH